MDPRPTPTCPWLDAPGANAARITLWTRRLAPGLYSADVPPESFRAALRRAARHRGYTARQSDLRVYVSGEHTLELPTAPEDRVAGAGRSRAHEARVTRTRVLSAHELPGAPLLACTLQRDALPFSRFPCGAPVHDARVTRRLSLRVHRRARLVFETHRSDGAAPLVRSVYIAIDLDPAGLAEDMDDLRRTVENTVHVVLLGARAIRRAK